MEGILNRTIVVSGAASSTLSVAAFVLLITLGAFIRIPLPFTPVPVTLQTFFVLLAGLLLGARLAAITQLSYLLLGVIGIPLFAGAGSGIWYLYGPSAGYLFGFFLAALFVGKCAPLLEGRFFPLLILLCLAQTIILACGVIWLGILFKYSLAKLLFIGFLPFIPGDFLKAAACVPAYLALRSRFRKA